MSTVTLSKPHCAITSAEKPDGIASHALTTALPEAQTSFTLFAIIVFLPLFVLFLVIAGLAPAIHHLRKTLHEDGWIRGSSPRMTALCRRLLNASFAYPDF